MNHATLLVAFAMGVVLAVACSAGGPAPRRLGPPCPSGDERPPVARAARRRAPSATPDRRPRRPARAGLDPEHEPHRVLRRGAGRAYADHAIDLRFLPYASTSPEILVSSGAGGLRDQHPGRGDVRDRRRGEGTVGHGAPGPHGDLDRRARRRGDHPAAPARRQALCRVRPAPGGARAPGGHPAPTAGGRVQDGDARHLRLRGAVRRQGRLHDHLQRLGGDRGAGAQGQAPDVRVHRLRDARTRTPSSSSATTPGWPPTATSRSGSWRPPRPASRPRRRTRTAPRPGSSPRTRACSTPTRAAARLGALPAANGLTATAGSIGRQTAAQWAAFSGFLFDTGLLAGPDGKPLTARPDFGTYFTNDFLP